MLRSVYLSLLLSQLAMTAIAQEAKSITEAESVIAIFTNDWNLGSSAAPQLITGIWGDGLIVWSNDPVNGGPPYFTAQLKPENVSDALKKISEMGAFEILRLKQAKFGPDSQFTTILVRTGGKELRMDSWHELSESNGNVVAADHGITGLEGRKLLHVLAEQPAHDLHYRLTWLELRLIAANLIPRSGTETHGVATMHQGKLSWKPRDDK